MIWSIEVNIQGADLAGFYISEIFAAGWNLWKYPQLMTENIFASYPQG